MVRYVSSPEHIINLSCRAFDKSIQEILQSLLPKALPSVRWSLCNAIIQREELRSTVLPGGVAFPRVETGCAKKIICAVGLSEKGITDEHTSDVPIHAMFVVLYPNGQFKRFVPVLENLVRFSKDPAKMAALKRLPDHRDEFRVIRHEVFPWGTRGAIHSHLFPPNTWGHA